MKTRTQCSYRLTPCCHGPSPVLLHDVRLGTAAAATGAAGAGGAASGKGGQSDTASAAEDDGGVGRSRNSSNRASRGEAAGAGE